MKVIVLTDGELESLKLTLDVGIDLGAMRYAPADHKATMAAVEAALAAAQPGVVLTLDEAVALMKYATTAPPQYSDLAQMAINRIKAAQDMPTTPTDAPDMSNNEAQTNICGEEATDDNGREKGGLMSKFKLLHIYPQTGPHDAVIIVGTQGGIDALKEALETKSTWFMGWEGEPFCNDGESFGIRVIAADEKTMKALPVPYVDEAASQPEHKWNALRRVCGCPPVDKEATDDNG